MKKKKQIPLGLLALGLNIIGIAAQADSQVLKQSEIQDFTFESTPIQETVCPYDIGCLACTIKINLTTKSGDAFSTTKSLATKDACDEEMNELRHLKREFGRTWSGVETWANAQEFDDQESGGKTPDGWYHHDHASYKSYVAPESCVSNEIAFGICVHGNVLDDIHTVVVTEPAPCTHN